MKSRTRHVERGTAVNCDYIYTNTCVWHCIADK